MPPRAGPAIVDTCQVVEVQVTALAKCSGGTSPGTAAWAAGAKKARATPTKNSTA